MKIKIKITNIVIIAILIAGLILPFIEITPVNAENIQQSYTTGDVATTTSQTGNDLRGQSFTTSSSYTLKRIEIYMLKVGAPGDCSLAVKSVDVDGKPTGSILTSENVTSSVVGTSASWVSFDVDDYVLSASTKYSFYLNSVSGDVNNYYGFRVDNTSPSYSGGDLTTSSNGGSTWTVYTDTNDMLFRTYDNAIGAPTFITDNASSLAQTTATLNGSISDLSDNSNVNVNFEYGITAAYGSITPNQSISSPQAYTADIIGLTPGITYHCRTNVIWGTTTTNGNDITFNTVSGEVTNIQQSVVSGDTSDTTISWDHFWRGQSFTTSSSYTITRIDIYGRKTGNPGTLRLDLYAVDGSGFPTGSSLANGSLSAGSAYTSNTWMSFYLTNYVLSSTTKYVFVIKDLTSNAGVDYWAFRCGQNVAYSGGCLTNSSTLGVIWVAYDTAPTPGDWDMLFRTYDNSPVGSVSPPTASTVDTNLGSYKTAGYTTAYLEGLVTYDGSEECQYRFVYGTSPSTYTGSTAWSGIDVRATKEIFYETIYGLSLNTTYYYRAEIKNTNAQANGLEKSFITKSAYINTTGDSWLPDYTYRKPIPLVSSYGAGKQYIQVVEVSNGLGIDSAGVDSTGQSYSSIFLNYHSNYFPIDIRFTASDGKTIIPYFTSDTGPSLTYYVSIQEDDLGADTNIYIYYGGDSSLVDIPPVGPWTNDPTAAINITNIAVENIVYDSVTNKFWWLVGDRTTHPDPLYLYSSSAINGPYVRQSSPVLSETGWDFDSCYLWTANGSWYIITERRVQNTLTLSTDAYLYKSSSVSGPYSSSGINNPILSHGADGTYDAWRVSEFDVQELNGNWYITYMSHDKGPVGGTYPADSWETGSVAISSNVEGPYTKYAGNPVLTGATVAGRWNYGLAKGNDINILRVGDRFYATAAGTRFGFEYSTNDASYGVFWTDDLINWTEFKGNPTTARAASGWDGFNLARPGGLIKYGDTYYMSYTGVATISGPVQGGIATAPAVGNMYGYPPEQVFSNYDTFNSYVVGTTTISNWRATTGFSIASDGTNTYTKSGSEAETVAVKLLNSNNVAIQADIKHTSADKGTQLFFIQSDNVSALQGHEDFYAGTIGGDSNDHLGIYEEGTELGYTNYESTINTWYHATFARSGNTFYLRSDNTKAESMQVTLEDVWAGGVRIGGTDTGKFDNFIIRPYTHPEPRPDVALSEETYTLNIRTDNAMSISSSSATLQGTVLNDGGKTIQVRFSYGLTSSYGSTTTWQAGHDDGSNNVVSQIVTGLLPSTIYHYRAEVIDSDLNVVNGANVTIVTVSIPPSPPSNFAISSSSVSSVTLSWVLGSGSNRTMINYSNTGFPLNSADGTQIYFESGNTFTHSGLTSGQKVYYSAWGEKNGVFSVLYSKIATSATVGGLQPPDITEIIDVKAYKDYASVGDRLFVIVYKVIYSDGDPATDMSDYFAIEMSYSGVLKAKTKTTMWGYRVASIYQNAASSMEWGLPYTVKLTGLSNKFGDTVPSDSCIMTSGDWMGNDKNSIYQWILQTANNIGSYYGVSLTKYTSSGNKLTSSADMSAFSVTPSGEQIFSTAISGLRDNVPSLFATSSSSLDKPVDDPHALSTVAASTIDIRWGVGTEANLDALGTSMLGGVSGVNIYLFLWIVLIFIAAFALFSTGSPILAGIGAIFVGVFAAWMGAQVWIILGIAGIVLAFMVLLEYIRG
jgi:hypothetical protein